MGVVEDGKACGIKKEKQEELMTYGMHVVAKESNRLRLDTTKGVFICRGGSKHGVNVGL